jgi:hypothetical protein
MKVQRPILDDGWAKKAKSQSHLPTLILVSGFLGSGKTTLLLSASSYLRSIGVRVGVIVNDQGGQLVDTRLMAAAGLATEEIIGGCFCCRFSGFLASVEKRVSLGSRVILAEPVGSCTDLLATIVEPIKRFHRHRFRLAPLTVLVDPGRAADLLGPCSDPDFAFLFQKQLTEAHQVWFSKADLYRSFPEIPGVRTRTLSARTGEGVAEWLEEVLCGEAVVGRFLEIDYQRYAEAEAALGWLNWQVELYLWKALTPAEVVGPMLEELDQTLTQAGVTIAHLKVFCQAETGFIRASICRNGEAPSVDGMLDASSALEHEILLNLRALASPDLLERVVTKVISNLPGQPQFRHRESFRPPAPKPEYQFTQTH